MHAAQWLLLASGLRPGPYCIIGDGRCHDEVTGRQLGGSQNRVDCCCGVHHRHYIGGAGVKQLRHLSARTLLPHEC